MLICYLSNTTEFHCTSIKLYLLVLKSKRKFMFEKSIWQFIIIIHLAAFLQFINLLAFKFCSNKYSLTQTQTQLEILRNPLQPFSSESPISTGCPTDFNPVFTKRPSNFCPTFLPNVRQISIRFLLPKLRRISIRFLPSVRRISIRSFELERICLVYTFFPISKTVKEQIQ